ncbi:hypothetical protein BJ165DRAFT_1350161, partial [Panaeolus papilionaceus]
ATHGDIKLYLPRSFHGPIIIAHRHGLVRFSDALAQDLTTFGEVDGVRRCFLGDFSSGLGTESGWTGDELLVEVRHANVKLQYCDDAPKTAVKSRPTFLNRIFGF